jgi:transcriptional regulator with XRE-family HTH domain
MSMHRSVSQPPQFTLSSAWSQIFGNMVQERRQAIHRSVEDCARLAGMEFSEWVAIEAGYVPSDSDRVLEMAAALEVRRDQMAMMAFLCQGAWAE